ncbi:hypothetical protein AAFF_G00012460 [Aldrovandia affinis]|uniref:Cytosol aminopeptidase domain-containing protein n=1 Tax=Aldrovandia affinis TaxID=143900 RepID=A0AAD7S6R0_9TELE|nr:hypothetical protein AAFF_G00012460 [Aldrovandia affinis]
MGFVRIQPIEHTTDCQNQNFDGIVLVAQGFDKLPNELERLKGPLQDYSSVDSGLTEEVVVLRVPGLPGNRLVYASTGPINRDYDDVRRFSDAAVNGIKRAMKAGMQRPLLVCPPHSSYENGPLVAALGALHALYMPLEVREAALKSSPHKVATLGLWAKDEAEGKSLFVWPALSRAAGWCPCAGQRSDKWNVYVHVLEKEYPCLAAVNRCANAVPRHQGRVIKLAYCGEGPVQHTLMLVGKGITYDTGGADIKAGGVMAGMHRDKCGAAAVAGFFQVLAELKPKHLKVVGAMAMVRNSVGSGECRLLMCRSAVPLPCPFSHIPSPAVSAAVHEVSPQLFTIATLTGHAIRAMGPNYSIIMDNGAAHNSGNAHQWQKAGEELGDVFEVSRIRREDYEFHRGKSEYEEILQSNNLPSSATPRGHQAPAAFLIMSSGLDKHGVDSDKPLPYSHIDIAGSSGPFPGVPTGAPILAMASRYILSSP